MYNKITRCIEHIGVLGLSKLYISYKFKNEKFTDNVLFKYMLRVAVENTPNEHVFKWGELKYPEYFNIYRFKVVDALLKLANNGIVIHNNQAVDRNKFVHLESLCLHGNMHKGGECSVTSSIVIDDNRLLFNYYAFDTKHIERGPHEIRFTRGRLDHVLSQKEFEPLDNYRLSLLMGGVADKSTAESLGTLFSLHQFTREELKAVLSEPHANKYFASVLQAPVEEVLSNILSVQLKVPHEDVKTLIDIYGQDNLANVIDSLEEHKQETIQDYDLPDLNM